MFCMHADSRHIWNVKWWIVVMLINVDKYRAAVPSTLSPSSLLLASWSGKKGTSNFIYLLTKFITMPTFVKKHVTRRRKRGSRDDVSNRHQSRGVVLMPAWFCAPWLCVMRPPNNQSLTRLPATLSARSDGTNVTPSPGYTANTDCRPPSRRAAKLWHVGFASILLNYPPGQESFSRSWIDKLPGPVFRRHVTLDVATSR